MIAARSEIKRKKSASDDEDGYDGHDDDEDDDDDADDDDDDDGDDSDQHITIPCEDNPYRKMNMNRKRKTGHRKMAMLMNA